MYLPMLDPAMLLFYFRYY